MSQAKPPDDPSSAPPPGSDAEDPYLAHLSTESRNRASEGLDRLDPEAFVELMCREDEGVVRAVRSQAAPIAHAIEAIAARMARGGRLIHCGAGTSGRLGVLDAAECPPTFRTDEGQVVGLIAGGPPAFLKAVEGAEDNEELGAHDLDALGTTADDSVVGIAASGRTPYVLGALAHARRVGALTIGFSCNQGSPVAAAAEIAITPVVGPEILSGSTRLKAGTATKMVLNALSTGVMVRLGKCYDNLMVDLQATNEKLRLRSVRIVAQATGLDYDDAKDLLARCGGDVKVAIVSSLGGGGGGGGGGGRDLDPDEARRRLAAADGFVRAAIEGSGR